MAYADYDFYKNSYCGDVLTEDNAKKWLTRASDEVDMITFHRLASGFPTVDGHAVRVRKAVCAVAETLYRVDEQRQAMAAVKDGQGNYHGPVTTVSSGRESISYASNAAASSVYAKAAADNAALGALILGDVARYLAGVPDANGVNLLYAGVS